MRLDDFLGTLKDIKTPIALAGFAIAAVLAIVNAYVAKPTVSVRKVVWFAIVAICVLAILPAAIEPLIETQKQIAVYRIRVLTLDDRGIFSTCSTLKASVPYEIATGLDGSCQLSVPRATLPASGKVTVFADNGNLHGREEVTLGADANPSLTVKLSADRSAGVRGIVEDEDNGTNLIGVSISAAGVESVLTGADGSFAFSPFTAPGQQVRLHAEKAGYLPADVNQMAGDQSVVITLRPVHRAKK